MDSREQVRFCRTAAAWLTAVGVGVLVSCAPQSRGVYHSGPAQSLSGYDKRVLIIPPARIGIRHFDNTRSKPAMMFADSFLIGAVRSFLGGELGRRLTVIHGSDSTPFPDTRSSVLAVDTHGLSRTAEQIREIAAGAGADLIATVYACSLSYTAFEQIGWRGGKYESSAYARPAKATGRARVHSQIWNSQGDLLFERIGSWTTRKPFLYDLFNGRRMRARREQALSEDPVKAVRRFYAPPMLKALFRATRLSLQWT